MTMLFHHHRYSSPPFEIGDYLYLAILTSLVTDLYNLKKDLTTSYAINVSGKEAVKGTALQGAGGKLVTQCMWCVYLVVGHRLDNIVCEQGTSIPNRNSLLREQVKNTMRRRLPSP